MKPLRCILLALCMISAWGGLRADIATEGEVDVRVQLMNGESFKGFTFFIRYQHYTYDMGYQPSGLSDEVLEPGKHVTTGDRGDASLLYARDKNGKEYVSDVEVGGVEQGQASEVSYILQQIEVTGVKKGKVKFKVASTQKIGSDGKVLGVQEGAVEFNWAMLLLPVACLLGLVGFFIVRRVRFGKAGA